MSVLIFTVIRAQQNAVVQRPPFGFLCRQAVMEQQCWLHSRAAGTSQLASGVKYIFCWPLSFTRGAAELTGKLTRESAASLTNGVLSIWMYPLKIYGSRPAHWPLSLAG